MDLDELRAFFAILDAGSPSAAARRLGQPRASLRRRLAELEARVGAPLFARGSTGVVLTAPGEALAQRGRPLLERHTAMLQRAAGSASAQLRPLRLGLGPGVPACALAPLVAALVSATPGLELRLLRRDKPWAQLLDDLDVALSLGDEAPADDLVRLRLGRLDEGAFISPALAAVHGPPRRVDELVELPLAHWGAEEEEPSWHQRTGAPLRLRCAVQSADPALVADLVRGGFGVGWMPAAVAGGLLPVLPEQLGRRRALHAWVPAVLRGTAHVDRVVAAAALLAAADGAPPA
ncbi:MAG: LysR family transcriptional regulator [Deltaproteobacteria bacterium]|nr:LysR family transcriptional regulator [Deltaproteobacteria bacterium]